MSVKSDPQKQASKSIRFFLGVVFAALSGGMLLLSFPPYGIWWLAWFAFVPGIFAQYRLLPLKWSSLAPSIFITLWLGPWMYRLFGTEYSPFFSYLGVLIGIIVFFGHKERKFHEATKYRWFILQGVIDWVGFEMIRGTVIPLVATSAFIGYTQATQAWLIQPVSIFSVYGLNLVIMLVNFALAQGIIAWFDKVWHPIDVVPLKGNGTRNWLVAAGSVLAIWIGISLVLINRTPEVPETVRVAAIQPNYTKPAFQDEDLDAQTRFDDFSKWTRQAADLGAEIIFTPEMAFDFDPQEEFSDEFRALAKETGAYIFINYAFWRDDQPWRNETKLLAPNGEFYTPPYAKNHAPPGEQRSSNAGIFPVYDTPLGELAALICHDGNYTDVSRKLTRNGAQLISAGLNEFGRFGEQFWTNMTFRAVENRTPVVVIARSTGTAIIDPYGHQVNLDITPNKQLILIGDVSLGTGEGTLYTSLGDVLGWIMLAAYIGMVIFQIRVQNKIQKDSQA
jgi:apolipoprotein N-acyltransferase